jgi:hypothetical protein
MLNKCIGIYKIHVLCVYYNLKLTFLIPGTAKPCPVRVIAPLRGEMVDKYGSWWNDG